MQPEPWRERRRGDKSRRGGDYGEMQITRQGGKRKGETTRAIGGEWDDVELQERQRES